MAAPLKAHSRFTAAAHLRSLGIPLRNMPSSIPALQTMNPAECNRLAANRPVPAAKRVALFI